MKCFATSPLSLSPLSLSSLYDPGCTRTCSIDQASLKLRGLPASVPWVLESEVCATTSQPHFCSFNHELAMLVNLLEGKMFTGSSHSIRMIITQHRNIFYSKIVLPFIYICFLFTYFTSWPQFPLFSLLPV